MPGLQDCAAHYSWKRKFDLINERIALANGLEDGVPEPEKVKDLLSRLCDILTLRKERQLARQE